MIAAQNGPGFPAVPDGLRLGAVVPAAGLSSRMGRLKPALPLGTATVLECAVACLREAGAAEVVVVTGREADTVGALARRAGARPVHNPRYAEGMFGSMTTGMAALGPEVDAFFVLPADTPLVRPATCRAVAGALAASGADWAVPRFAGRRGHPPVLRSRLIPTLAGHGGAGGLRAALEAPGLRAVDVDVPDAAVLLDLDEPGDYERAVALAARRHVPRAGEVEMLWTLAGTPEATRAHCRAVGRAAAALARALNARPGGPAASAPLDPALAEAGGLLHDLAKGHRRHEAEGGRLLAAWGFTALAPLVADHRDLDLAPGARPGERELVFLADKLVRGEEPVPVARRYDEKIAQWGHDPEVRRAIEARKARALAVEARVRGLLGPGAPDLLDVIREGRP
jgi:CTP:molybdopterin cytidylyltransferase MocA